MKSIGEIFKERRQAKKISLDVLESGTKIKKVYIALIEEGQWDKLPGYPVLSGFIKNIAEFLGIDKDKAFAIFKRDYPTKKVSPNPKPDVSKTFYWSPKATFGLLIGIVAIILSGYLFAQYKKSISAPELVVLTPIENQVVDSESVLVTGTTLPDATISANNQPIIVDESGNFTDEVLVSDKSSQIVVVARSRNGRETTIIRSIIVD